MTKYLQVIANRELNIYKNVEFLPEIFEIMKKYSKYLFDDYFNYENLLNIFEQTDFYAIYDENNREIAGFVFLDNWVGNSISKHSAEITTCFLKKYWGDYTKKCAKEFLDFCFKKYKFKKLKAFIYPQNLRVKSILVQNGFIKEATLCNETLKNGKLQNIDIYSLIKR